MENCIYVGKAKKLYSTENPNEVVAEYLDQATAFNGVKKDIINGKGALNNRITTLLFEYLTEKGVNNHFIKQIDETKQLLKKLTMIPLEVVVRNIAAGSFSKRYGVEEGEKLKKPTVEFFLKNDDLDDPMICEDVIESLNILSNEEILYIKQNVLKLNEILVGLYKSVNLKLVDFKVEYGKDVENNIILGDEISPDTCRLWDIDTNEHFDKDVYRKDIGDLITTYNNLLNRLENR